MKTEILTAIIGILGVFIGVVFQFFFGKKTNTHQHALEREAKAYSDFIKGVVLYGSINKYKDIERQEAYKIYLDAKIRICLYGNKKVITSLSRFIELGSVIGNKEQRVSFIEIIKSMRRRVKNQFGSITDEEIGNIVLDLSKKYDD